MYFIHNKKLIKSISLVLLFILTISFFSLVVTENKFFNADNQEKEIIEEEPYLEDKESPISNENITLNNNLELDNLQQNYGSSYIGENVNVIIEGEDALLGNSFLRNKEFIDVFYVFDNDEFEQLFELFATNEQGSHQDGGGDYSLAYRQGQAGGSDYFANIHMRLEFDMTIVQDGFIRYSYSVVFTNAQDNEYTPVYHTGSYSIDHADVGSDNSVPISFLIRGSTILNDGNQEGKLSINNEEVLDPSGLDGNSNRYAVIDISYFYFEPTNVAKTRAEQSIRTTYEYISYNQIVHIVEIENPFEDVIITIYHSPKWDYLSINVVSFFNLLDNRFQIVQASKVTYVIKFLQTIDNYANVEDVTHEYFDDPSFEKGNSVLYLEDNDVDDHYISNEFVFEGVQSYAVELTGGTVNIPLREYLDEGNYIFSIAIWDSVSSDHADYINIEYEDINNQWVEIWNNDHLDYDDKGYFNNIQARFRIDNSSVEQLRINIHSEVSVRNILYFDNLKLFRTELSIEQNELIAKEFSSLLINVDGYQNIPVPYVDVNVYLTNLENTDEVVNYGIITSDENGILSIRIEENLVAFNEYRIDLYTLEGRFNTVLRDSLTCDGYSATTSNGGCDDDTGNLRIVRGTNAKIKYRTRDPITNVEIGHYLLEGSMLYVRFSYRFFSNVADGTFRVEVGGKDLNGNDRNQINFQFERATSEQIYENVIDVSLWSEIEEIDFIPQMPGQLTLYEFKVLTHDRYFFTPIESGLAGYDNLHQYTFTSTGNNLGWTINDRNLYTIDSDVSGGIYEIGGLKTGSGISSVHNSFFFVSPVIDDIDGRNSLELRIRANKEYFILLGNAGNDNTQVQTIDTTWRRVSFDLSNVDFNVAGYENRILLAFDTISTSSSSYGFNSNTRIEIDTIDYLGDVYYEPVFTDLGDIILISSLSNTLSYLVLIEGIPFYVNDLELFDKPSIVGEHAIDVFIIFDSQFPDIIQVARFVLTYEYSVINQALKNLYQLYYLDSEGTRINDFELITRYGDLTIDNNYQLSLYGGINIDALSFSNYLNSEIEYNLTDYSLESSTEDNLYTIFLQFDIERFSASNVGDSRVELVIAEEHLLGNYTYLLNNYTVNLDPGSNNEFVLKDGINYTLQSYEVIETPTGISRRLLKTYTNVNSGIDVSALDFSSPRQEVVNNIVEQDTVFERVSNTGGNILFSSGLGVGIWILVQLFGSDIAGWIKINFFGASRNDPTILPGDKQLYNNPNSKESKKKIERNQIAGLIFASVAIVVGLILSYAV